MKTPLNLVEQSVLDILTRNMTDNRSPTDTLTDIREFLKEPEKVEPLRIWYMRDNHTFAELDLNIEIALKQIQHEWTDGYTCGMVCSKFKGAPEPVHGRGTGTWDTFEKQVRNFYRGIENESN